MLSVSFANATTLNIDVTVDRPTINLNEDQLITATSNEDGRGILIVIQPAAGTPWQDFLDDNPLLKIAYNALPANVQDQIEAVIGDKIVSYKIVEINNPAGGSQQYSFLTDFKEGTGTPSTAIAGEYKVLFAFVSISGCFCIEKDFACGSWHVVPESPIGTAMAIIAPIAALATITIYKKRKA